VREITDWVRDECSAYRHFIGTDGNQPENRVAMIESTPRVRIRSDHYGCEREFNDAGNHVGSARLWPEWLDWCSGYKGDGPDDPESRAWCDGMLKAMGYEL